MAYIEFRNLIKAYGDKPVLKNINLKIKRGDFVTLLGPSGCGKSTLLRCLAGLEAVTSGRIILDSDDITEKSPSERGVGMVFQQYSLFPNMTASQNIAFGLKMRKYSKETIREKVVNAINMVELNGFENAYPESLSGGQQQRVALARSIVMEPKVLLLDEPLSAIDAKLRRSLQQRIKEIHEELGLTVIFVTHDQDEAMIMSDVIHLFHDGQIEQTGDPVSMYTAPRTVFAAGFIGSYNIIAKERFAAMTGKKHIDSDIAIRPETICMSKEPVKAKGCIALEGIIKGNTPRGNVLRYSIDVSGTELNADVLFRSFALYEDETHVFLSIPEKDCLEVAE